MARIQILYFLEDIAQEGFIISLVKRVAREASISENSLLHSIRTARGGSRVLPQFEAFMKDHSQASPADIDLLVVAMDGNCQGYSQKLRDIRQFVTPNHPYKEKVICAIPDPHIERWYLMDQRAFKEGVGVTRSPGVPTYKCDKDYYKNLLHQALADSDIKSLLGGTEYAESIIEKMHSLDIIGQSETGFASFIADLRSFYRRIKDR
jgi:hypothetical protein